MSKIVFGYSYTFYSMYVYYKNKMNLSKDWPEGWSVFAISMLVTLVIWTLELSLVKAGVLQLGHINAIKWLPKFLQPAWIYLFVVFFNFYFFFLRGNWKDTVNKYDKLPYKTRYYSHAFSLFIIMLIVVIYLVTLFTFDI